MESLTLSTAFPTALNEGETLAIVGESGCGKSVGVMSLMRLIPQPPGKITGGEVLFGTGDDRKDLLKLSDEEIRQVRGNRIAMIFQDPMTSLNPVLTIGFQISEALILHMGMDKAAARKRSVELLELVGIPRAADRLDDYPHQFSGGMRQRVMIAMGLSCNPQLLIADEPTTALDVTIQAQITDLVKRLRDEIGMAIIWITHDLGVVAGLADRMIVMYAGFIVEESPVKDLYANPRHPYTIGLLGSLPRLDEVRAHRLRPLSRACRPIWSTCPRAARSMRAASIASRSARPRIPNWSRSAPVTRPPVGWMCASDRAETVLAGEAV